MALIVEDGTGIETAEAFSDVAEADAYFLRRNVTAWAALNVAAKEAALMNGAAFLTEQYEARFVGVRSVPTQGLSWPRAGVPAPYGPVGAVLPATLIPAPVRQAALEAALIFSSDNPYDPRESAIAGGELVSERKKIGPLETELKYSTSGSAAKVSTAMPKVETDRISAILAPFITAYSFGQFRTERA